MEYFAIKKEDAEIFLSYLIKKPFEEVVGMVQILQKLQKVNISEPEKPEPTKPEIKKAGEK